MKKSVVVLTLLLIASIAGTYAVYELYVKQRMRDLGDHRTEARKLEEKIETLETTFFKTKPDVVLREWRNLRQPWADAVERRARFFNLGDLLLEVEIPEERIPRFYYRDEYPKRVRALENEAFQSGTMLADYAFEVPPPGQFGRGTDPTAKEISKHLVDWEFGASISRLLIKAEAISVDPIRIWPEENEVSGHSGHVKSRTVGLSFRMTTRKFVEFMDRLSQEDRYFQVKAIRITNTAMRDPGLPLSIEMILSQAFYEPKTGGMTIGGGAGTSEDTTAIFASLFGGGDGDGAGGLRRSSGRKKLTAWQRFRKRFLPF